MRRDISAINSFRDIDGIGGLRGVHFVLMGARGVWGSGAVSYLHRKK